MDKNGLILWIGVETIQEGLWNIISKYIGPVNMGDFRVARHIDMTHKEV